MKMIALTLLLVACGSDDSDGPVIYDCDELQKLVSQSRGTCRMPAEPNPFGTIDCPNDIGAYCTAPGTCPTSGWGTACDNPGPSDCYYIGSCRVVGETAEFDYQQTLNGVTGMAVSISGAPGCEFRPCSPL